jgi:hypothetical protein
MRYAQSEKVHNLNVCSLFLWNQRFKLSEILKFWLNRFEKLNHDWNTYFLTNEDKKISDLLSFVHEIFFLKIWAKISWLKAFNSHWSPKKYFNLYLKIFYIIFLIFENLNRWLPTNKRQKRKYHRLTQGSVCSVKYLIYVALKFM